MQGRGAVAFDYGYNLRTQAKARGCDGRLLLSRLCTRIHSRFVFAKGVDRFGGLRSQEIHPILRQPTRRLLDLFPEDKRLQEWLTFASSQVAFQGLPARICCLGIKNAIVLGLLFNQMVRDGRLKAPIVIGRDHLDAGSVASPFRETEAMLDGSDAVSDWALLNFATASLAGQPG